MTTERDEQVGWLHNKTGQYEKAEADDTLSIWTKRGWQPVYVKVPDPVGTAAQTVQESEPEVRLTYREWLATQEWCPTCLSTGPRHPIPDFCPDPWHSTAGPSVLADTDPVTPCHVLTWHHSPVSAPLAGATPAPGVECHPQGCEA